MKKVLVFITIIFCFNNLCKAGSAQNIRFKVPALYENAGHHQAYAEAALVWLDNLARDSSFTIDYVQNTNQIDEEYLNSYQLIAQLDYVPCTWKDKAALAFQKYITEDRRGWIGFHHTTLPGGFDGYPMWQWFSVFMRDIRFKSYIPGFAGGKVNIEDKCHSVMRGVPASFIINKEEWYTYNKSPRSNAHFIASVDESGYIPGSKIKMGDHPVIRTNEHYKARNIYIFAGHSPDLFDSEACKLIFKNAIFWAAGNSKGSKTEI